MLRESIAGAANCAGSGDAFDRARNAATCVWHGRRRSDSRGSTCFIWNASSLLQKLIRDEWMIDCVVGLHPSIWIPPETSCDEVQKRFIVRL